MDARRIGPSRRRPAPRTALVLILGGLALLAGPLVGAVDADEEPSSEEVTTEETPEEGTAPQEGTAPEETAPEDGADEDGPNEEDASGEDGAEQSGSAVTITTTPSGVTGPCLPPLLALSNTTSNTEDAFTLRITVSAPLCDPVDAAAVVYAMPGDGEAWPQTLVERVDFRLDAAGVTEVRFAKECDPVQFDVITGASPQVISPLGEWHGPLLFPTDLGTALQYFGDREGCDGDTSGTTTTTTTTTSSTLPEIQGTTTLPEPEGTTTVPVEVESVTTVPVQIVPEPPSAASSPAEVLGSQQTPATQATAAPSTLARTGATSLPGVWLGAVLVLAGAVTLGLSRRRRA